MNVTQTPGVSVIDDRGRRIPARGPLATYALKHGVGVPHS